MSERDDGWNTKWGTKSSQGTGRPKSRHVDVPEMTLNRRTDENTFSLTPHVFPTTHTPVLLPDVGMTDDYSRRSPNYLLRRGTDLSG